MEYSNLVMLKIIITILKRILIILWILMMLLLLLYLISRFALACRITITIIVIANPKIIPTI